MKRFFYVTFDSLNFALVTSITFSLCLAGVKKKANLDRHIRPWSLICTTIPIVVTPKCFCRTYIYTSLMDQGFKASMYVYVFGIQRVKSKDARTTSVLKKYFSACTPQT